MVGVVVSFMVIMAFFGVAASFGISQAAAGRFKIFARFLIASRTSRIAGDAAEVVAAASSDTADAGDAAAGSVGTARASDTADAGDAVAGSVGTGRASDAAGSRIGSSPSASAASAD